MSASSALWSLEDSPVTWLATALLRGRRCVSFFKGLGLSDNDCDDIPSGKSKNIYSILFKSNLFLLDLGLA